MLAIAKGMIQFCNILLTYLLFGKKKGVLSVVKSEVGMVKKDGGCGIWFVFITH